MKPTMWILLLLFGLCVCISAQEKAGECPTISVTGPAGIVPPGEIMTYIASVEKKGDYTLQYKWSFSNGNIESGQGTSIVRVRRTSPVGSPPVATVEIEGLPRQCANTASETSCELQAPQAGKVDQFAWPLNSTIEERLRKIAETVNNNPTAQLYIFAPPGVIIRKALSERLLKAVPEHGIDGMRMTFVENISKNSLIQFWLVPAGTTPPSKCEDCEPRSVLR